MRLPLISSAMPGSTMKKGESPLSQMMSAVLFGDYVSYYLALLNEVDPSPVAAIDYIKGRLARAEI